MLRIIAGKWRSRVLLQPPTQITRPTIDRIREAIFSSIQFKIPNAIILDLCAGSGAFSFESLSRGATKALAVEANEKAVKVIKQNAADLQVTNIDVYQMDILSFLAQKKGMKFDIIFLDPPYENENLYNDALKLISENKMLNTLGIIVLEKSDRASINVPADLAVQKRKSYGKTVIWQLANNI